MEKEALDSCPMDEYIQDEDKMWGFPRYAMPLALTPVAFSFLHVYMISSVLQAIDMGKLPTARRIATAY